MNRKRIGIVIIVGTLICIAAWEFWGREAISLDKVLVLKKDTPENTVVHRDDMTVAKIENADSDALRPDDIDSIIGMRTSQYVAGGTELRKEYFAQSLFYLGEDTDKAVMALPADWLLSYPQAGRQDKPVFRPCKTDRSCGHPCQGQWWTGSPFAGFRQAQLF